MHHESAGEIDHLLWWARSPDEEAELYARKGVLVPIGFYENAIDGQSYHVYLEKRSLWHAILEDLEVQGLAVRTGEMRAARDGRMEPVYVAVRNAFKRPEEEG